MNHTVEPLNEWSKKMAINFDQTLLSSLVRPALIKKQKTTVLKGFRKGKVPLNIIEKIYGHECENTILNDLIEQEIQKFLAEEKLEMTRPPSVENLVRDQKKGVSVDVTIEIFPKIKLKDYSNLSFKEEIPKVEDSEIEEMKKHHLSNKAEIVELRQKDKTLEKGLMAVINFQGVTKNGERPEKLKGEEYLLEMGSHQVPPDFEAALVGMTPGDKKKIPVTFPHHEESFRGESVVFEVELLEIKEKILPNFDDALAKEIGFESAEDFTAKTKAMILENKKKQAREKLCNKIMEKLIEDNPFDIPPSGVELYKSSIKESTEEKLLEQGMEPLEISTILEKTDITKRALSLAKTHIIMDALSRELAIEINEEDYQAEIKKMTKILGANFHKHGSHLKNLREDLTHRIRHRKVFDALLEKITLTRELLSGQQ